MGVEAFGGLRHVLIAGVVCVSFRVSVNLDHVLEDVHHAVVNSMQALERPHVHDVRPGSNGIAILLSAMMITVGGGKHRLGVTQSMSELHATCTGQLAIRLNAFLGGDIIPVNATVRRDGTFVMASHCCQSGVLKMMLLTGIVGSQKVESPLHGVSCQLAPGFVMSPYIVQVRLPRLGCSLKATCTRLDVEAVLQQGHAAGTAVYSMCINLACSWRPCQKSGRSCLRMNL